MWDTLRCVRVSKKVVGRWMIYKDSMLVFYMIVVQNVNTVEVWKSKLEGIIGGQLPQVPSQGRGSEDLEVQI